MQTIVIITNFKVFVTMLLSQNIHFQIAETPLNYLPKTETKRILLKAVPNNEETVASNNQTNMERKKKKKCKDKKNKKKMFETEGTEQWSRM